MVIRVAVNLKVPHRLKQSAGLLIDTHETFDINAPEVLKLPRDTELSKSSQTNQQM